MPRHPRRPRLDFSHLAGRPAPFVFDEAVQRPDARYPPDGVDRRAADNQDLLALFGGQEFLRYDEAMDRFREGGLWRRSETTGKPWSTNAASERCGRLIGIGLRDSLVAEGRTDEGERAWRLLCREPAYEVVGRATYRCRLATTEELRALAEARAKVARRAVSTEKLRRTLDAKRARHIRSRVHTMLGELADLGVAIPQEWVDRGYVAPDVRERWPLVRDALGLLVDMHLTWRRDRLDAWEYALRYAVSDHRAKLSRAARAAQMAVEAETPADDLDFLATL